MFDVHGDETHPHVFLNGRDTDCAVDSDLCAVERLFWDAYRFEGDYLQNKSCYAPSLPGQSNKNIAKNFFAERLHCLSFTVEMPDKEIVVEKKRHAEPIMRDWTSDDCKQFGAHLIPALLKVMPRLSTKKLQSQAMMPSSIAGIQKMEALPITLSIIPSIVLLLITLYRHFLY